MGRGVWWMLSILYAQIACAQDIHFSEFYAPALNLNPAQAGQFRGDWRVGVSYRDQYRAVADPFQTVSVFADKRESKLGRRGHSAGYGVVLNADVAGDANFGTYEFGIPLALHFAMSPKIRVSTGFYGGLQTMNIDEDELSFGEQYDGFAYDEDIISAEPGGFNNSLRFTLGAGMNYMQRFSDRSSFSVGMSAFNINRPQRSFYSDSDSELPRRYTLHGLVRFQVLRYADAIPMLKYSIQGPHDEFQLGGQMYHYLQGLSVDAINYGLWVRTYNLDAIILNAGFVVKMLYVGLNYDINTSGLSQASGHRGAFEIHIILYFDKSKLKKKQRSVSCPGHF